MLISVAFAALAVSLVAYIHLNIRGLSRTKLIDIISELHTPMCPIGERIRQHVTCCYAWMAHIANGLTGY